MAGGEDGLFGAFEGTHAAEISPDPARAAKVGATAATVEAAIGDLAQQLAQPAEAEQASLMLDEMDEQMALFAGPVKHVADTIAGARGRGRPKGSTNKNSFAEIAMRMGYRHPGLNLLAIASADPVELAQELGAYKTVKGMLVADECTPLEAMQLIIKANAELLPYFEGKAAQKVEINGKIMGVMVIGEMPTDRKADDGIIDLTNVAKPE